MKVIQWTMKIPKDKQEKFVEWFKDVAGPQFNTFGATKHELYKVDDKEAVPKQITEEDVFIERLYFESDADVDLYFAKAKADEKIWAESRKFETEFGAHDIELRVLDNLY